MKALQNKPNKKQNTVTSKFLWMYFANLKKIADLKNSDFYA